MKRDKIFYGACILSALGILAAVLGSEISFIFFVTAYLLRPVVMEFGLRVKFADERERTIHAKSGDVAFVVLIVAMIGFCMLEIAHGRRPEILYELIAIGLAARALTGLVMNGEYKKAGVMIISTVGFFLGLFIIMEGGLSLVSLFGAAVAFVIFGVSQLAKKFPRTVASLIAFIVAVTILKLGLYNFKQVQSALWLFVITPMTISSACLFLGSSKNADDVSPKTAYYVFGALSVCALFIFTMLMVFGSREEQHPTTFKELNPGVATEIQGYHVQGTVNYFENGKLSSCILAREDTVLGQPLPAGTQLNFLIDGRLDIVCLPSDTYIQSYLCKGEGPGTWHTVFYPNGQLKLMWSAKDQWIQGIPCREASFWTDAFGGGVGVHFYPNGKLMQCKLAQDFSLDGHFFKRGQHINFDENGQLVIVKK